MRQVDKKFLEEQVKLVLENKNNPKVLNEAIPAAVIAAGIGVSLIYGAFAWRTMVRDYFKNKKVDFAEKGGENVLGWMDFLDIASNYIIGDWDYAYKPLGLSIKQSLKYGISPGGYISAAMEAQKDMDPYSKVLFRFIEAKPPISEDGVQLGSIAWKENVFSGLRKIINSHQSKIRDSFFQNNKKETGSLIQKFMDDVFELLDDEGISDRTASLRNNIYTFGLDDNQAAIDRDVKAMFKPGKEWCTREASRLLKNKESYKRDIDLKIYMEEMILNTNHLFFKKGFSSFSDLRCQEVNKRTLVNISALAVHAKSIEQSTSWAVIGLGLFDIILSLFSTITLFMGGYALKAGQSFLKFALAQYCRSYIKFLFGSRMLQATQRLAGLINSQTKFNTVTRLGLTTMSMTLEMTIQLNQDYGLKLAKLKQYHKAYFEILKSNRFDPADFGIYASQDMSIAGNYIWDQIGAIYDMIMKDNPDVAQDSSSTSFSDDVTAMSSQKDKDKQKIAAIDFTRVKDGTKRKKQLLDRLLYGTGGVSIANATTGILKTYEEILRLQFRFVGLHTEALEKVLSNPGENAPQPEKFYKGLNSTVKEVEKYYLAGKELECEQFLDSFDEYQETIEKSKKEIKENQKKAKMLDSSFGDVKEKQIKDLRKIANDAKISLSAGCEAPTATYQQDASPAITGPEQGAEQETKTTTLAQLDPIDVIIIGDSNANSMLRHFKGNTNPTNHVAKGGARAAEILRLLKAHFKKNYPSLSEQTKQKRIPKAAIIHMGYNGPSENLQAMKDTVVFLKEKGIKDIRIVDIKVDTPKKPRYEKNIKSLSAELKKLPSQYPGVIIIPNNGELNSKLPKGDGFHYTPKGYRQIIKDSLGGGTFNIPAASAIASGAATAGSAAKPETETSVTSGDLNISNPRATEMISDVEKFLGAPLSDSQTQNLENIYKAVISQLSFIKDKDSWNAYRYAVGKKESGNTYNPYKTTGAWRNNRYTARYAIGPGPYKMGRQIMSKHGVVLPNYKYIGDKKWSPGSQEKYYNDPIAQEGSFAGFVIHNKNKVQGHAKDAKDELALPGIAHNIGPAGMRRWAKIREEYRKTKDVKHLYRLWSLQDGYGTPGENFARISLRQTGSKIPDLPQGWLWYYKDSKGNVRRDYDKLEQIKQFDEKLGNYLEKGWPFCDKVSCDPRIFAFTKEDYAERVWKWVMNSGQANSTKRNSANNKSKNIQDYYNENGDPIGSPSGGFSFSSAGAPPSATTAAEIEKQKEKEKAPEATKKAEKNIASILKTGVAMTAKDAEIKLQKRTERIGNVENFWQLTVETSILYGTSISGVLGRINQAKEYLDKSRSGDLTPFTNVKFSQLKEQIHYNNRSKFFDIYKKVKEEDEQRANELMAYLHRPRILVFIDVNRLLYTGKSTYSLSFELGPPYTGRVGVINQWHPFFNKDSFGETNQKANLLRILKMNKETFEALYDRLSSFGPGEVEVARLTMREKDKYLKFYKLFIDLLSDGINALIGSGSTLRKAIAMENLAAALYLLG
tara:strand:- start:7974 stop:12551 length:4578 start_codon:yes stop_codon:yes gene_type:complete